MPSAYTPGILITHGTLVQRERRLPVKGEVLVSEGQPVQPDTIIARAFLPGELVPVRVAELLGVPPLEAAAKLLARPGQQVQEGERLAEARFLWGLIRSEVRAPVAGAIEYWSDVTGHLGIRLPAQPVTVSAFIGGRIEQTLAGEGAVVSAVAAVIQGVIGVGPEAHGPVRLLAGYDDLDATCRGALVVFTGCADGRFLARCTEVGVSGLLAASVTDADLAGFLGRQLSVAVTGDEELPYPLVLTEGFGDIGMSQRALAVARAVEGRVGSLSARTQIRAGAVRPELLVPVEQPAETRGAVSSQLAVGTPVRLIRPPNFGRLGTVSALPGKPQPIATGAVVPVVEVQLATGGRVSVPRANVEVVG